MFPQYSSLTPREKIRLAKQAILEAEKEEIEMRRQNSSSRRVSYAPSIEESVEDEDEASSHTPSRSSSLRSARESARRSQPPSSFHLPSTSTPSHYVPSSPVPSAPLPPLPSPSPSVASLTSITDFGPLPPLPSPGAAATAPLRRPSSRLRFSESDNGHATITATTSTPPSSSLNRSSSVRALRHHSSIEGLHRDLASATRSLRLKPKPKRISVPSSDSAWSSSGDSHAAEGAVVVQDAFKPQALPYPKIRQAPSGSGLGSASEWSPSPVQLIAFTPAPTITTTTTTARLSLSSTTSSSSSAPSRNSLTYTPSETSSWSRTSVSSSGDSPGPAVLGLGGVQPGAYPSPFAAGKMAMGKFGKFQIGQGVSPTVERREVLLSPTSKPLVVEAPAGVIELVSAAEGESDESAQAGPSHKADRGHQRADSTMSAIMAFGAFPLPPDRVRAFDAEVDAEGEVEVEVVLEVQMAEQPQPSLMVEEVEGEWTGGEQGKEELEQGAKLAYLEEESILSLDSPRAEGEKVVVLESPKLPRPTSPDVGEVMRAIARSRRRSSVGSGDDTEESDLDLSTPLVAAALRSKILNPNSRLLSASPSPSPSARLRPTHRTSSYSSLALRSMTSGKGWSGSDSEEEGWAEAVRSISLRKARASASPSPPKGLRGLRPSPIITTAAGLRVQVDAEVDVERTPTPKRFLSGIPAQALPSSARTPSLSPFLPSLRKPLNRLSQTSTTSTSSSSSSCMDAGPVTPGLTLELGNLTPQVVSAALRRSGSTSSAASSAGAGSSVPGDFPWGASSPPASPIRGAFARVSSRESFFSQLSGASGPPTPTKEKRMGVCLSPRSPISPRPTPVSRTVSTRLPTPKRTVEGWGRPEVLLDDDSSVWSRSWAASSASGSGSEPSTAVSAVFPGSITLDDLSSDEDDEEARTARVPARARMPGAGMEMAEKTPRAEVTPRATFAGGRVPSPEMWKTVGKAGGEEGEGSLMDEEMPEFTPPSSPVPVVIGGTLHQIASTALGEVNTISPSSDVRLSLSSSRARPSNPTSHGRISPPPTPSPTPGPPALEEFAEREAWDRQTIADRLWETLPTPSRSDDPNRAKEWDATMASVLAVVHARWVDIGPKVRSEQREREEKKKEDAAKKLAEAQARKERDANCSRDSSGNQ